ncbi:transcription antitermination factor NusB [Lachnospiraceae bacterium]|nr:transcription antitermination factor NusB [Lachnospiraceae bacterium]
MVRTELREHVFKMLFQVEFNRPDEMPEHLRLYFESLEHATDRDQEYIRTKYEKVIPLIPEIDALINAKSTDWKTKRMNKVDLAILRLAVYEMKWDPDIPTGVAINEAVELAKRFSGEESPAFVNGVLGRLAGRQDEPVSRGPKPEAKSEPKPKPEAKSEPKPKPEAKLESKPKPEAKSEPKPKPEAKSESKPTLEPKPEAKLQPEVKSESES